MCDDGITLCNKEQTAFELLWEPPCGYVWLAVTTLSWSWGPGDRDGAVAAAMMNLGIVRKEVNTAALRLGCGEASHGENCPRGERAREER